MDPLVRLARVPRRPSRGDLVLTGAVVCWGLLEATLGTGPGTTLTRILFALVVSLPLAVRRQAPLAVAVVIASATLAWALAADRPESGTFPFPSILIAIFSAALYGSNVAGAIAGGVLPMGAMLVALNTDFNSGTPSAGNLAILIFFCAGTWAAGWLVRRRAAQVRMAYAESGELARSAVAEERARIARELHDVVAHSVSIVAVQAGAAEELIETDPAAARTHLQSVRRTAREAMTEMRRLLDVLRTDDASYVPQPGLSRLPDLLDEVRGAGVPVELVEEGQPRELPPGVDLVAFRLVQESLTNVRKHAAGAPTRLGLDYRPDSLELEVVNAAGRAQAAAPNARGGHGLFGMSERVRLFGGSFEAGERPDGGFRVHAVLPLENGQP